jgi:hypothetical protein
VLIVHDVSFFFGLGINKIRSYFWNSFLNRIFNGNSENWGKLGKLGNLEKFGKFGKYEGKIGEIFSLVHLKKSRLPLVPSTTSFEKTSAVAIDRCMSSRKSLKQLVN